VGEVAITRRLVAIGRQLINIRRTLIQIRAGLITVGPRLVAVRPGLVVLSARPFILGFSFTGDHPSPFRTRQIDLTKAHAP
jgi:hypothetical protein